MDATTILRRHADLKAYRGTWDNHWKEIADLVWPEQSDFFGAIAPGSKRTAKQFSSVAARAKEAFGAILESILTPRNDVWHRLKAKGLREGDAGSPVAQWYDRLNEALFDYRYAPRAMFASASQECYTGLGVFGTAALYISGRPNHPLWYKAHHLSEVFFAENGYGEIDTVHREYKLAARSIVALGETGEFDADRIPQQVREKAAAKPDEELTVIHCVYPNMDRIPGREDAAGMPFRGAYVLPEQSAVIREGGYTSFPWAISRYWKGPREVYGRSPAMAALPDIKTLNEAAKARIKAWHRANDPVLLVADDGILTPFNTRPGALNMGGVDENGRPRVLPLQSGERVDIDLAMTQEWTKGINDVFLVGLFMMAVENPNMTATEVLERARQQGMLLAPAAGRQQSEFLGPLIEREIDLLARAGLLPPPPDEIMETGAEYQIEYVSPLASAARAQEAMTALQFVGDVAGLAQIDPSAVDRIDVDETVKVLARARGVPAKMLRPDDVVEAIRDQRAEREALQTAVQSAQPVAGAMQAMAGVQPAAA